MRVRTGDLTLLWDETAFCSWAWCKRPIGGAVTKETCSGCKNRAYYSSQMTETNSNIWTRSVFILWYFWSSVGVQSSGLGCTGSSCSFSTIQDPFIEHLWMCIMTAISTETARHWNLPYANRCPVSKEMNGEHAYLIATKSFLCTLYLRCHRCFYRFISCRIKQIS